LYVSAIAYENEAGSFHKRTYLPVFDVQTGCTAVLNKSTGISLVQKGDRGSVIFTSKKDLQYGTSSNNRSNIRMRDAIRYIEE
jgi:hypothetical protein